MTPQRPASLVEVTTPSAVARQLEFLGAFPAYEAVRDGDTTWLGYRGRNGAPRLVGLQVDRGGSARVWGSLDRARFVLQTNVDVRPIDAHMRPLGVDHPLSRLHARYRGTRPVQFGDPFEGLCWTVLAQQVSVVAAASVKHRLTRTLGSAEVAATGIRVPIFPAPSCLLAAGGGLRELGVSRQKAATMLRLAQAADADDALWTLARAPTDEAYAALARVGGVGPWSARYALLRVYGHRDVLPAADVGLRRAWGREAGLGRTATAAEVAKAAEAMPGWRSYVAWYLWLSNSDARTDSKTTPVAPASGIQGRR